MTSTGGPESGWDHFIHILLLPDNIPIVGMLVLVFFFTWLAFREARKNDEMMDEGRRDDILKKCRSKRRREQMPHHRCRELHRLPPAKRCLT
jgi:hypothetical protein